METNVFAMASFQKGSLTATT